MSARTRRRRGFTLMEILLVLAILVVLGSMVSLGYVRIQKTAYVNSAKAQIALLEDAVKTYTISVGTPPPNLEALLQPPPELENPQKWQGPYLDKQQLPLDPWNHPFAYELIDPQNGTFRIWSAGPNGLDEQGGGDDISSAL